MTEFITDNWEIIVAIGSPVAALVGGAGGFFLTLLREQRQAKRQEQEAKRKFGADVLSLFQKRVEALESAWGP